MKSNGLTGSQFVYFTKLVDKANNVQILEMLRILNHETNVRNIEVVHNVKSMGWFEWSEGGFKITLDNNQMVFVDKDKHKYLKERWE